MSEPFLAEIKIVGFNFAPRGWALCDGQILPITQNESLYSLLGTTYGGDGRTTFALPDLRGRAPMHVGNGHRQGQKSGEESHTLSVTEIPAHKHTAGASPADADAADPNGATLGSANDLYRDATNLTPLHTATLANSGGGQAHNNMQPYLTLNFIIALQGTLPPRN